MFEKRSSTDETVPPLKHGELPNTQALLDTPPSRKDEIRRMQRAAKRAKDDASGSQARAKKRQADVDVRFRRLRGPTKRNAQ